MTYEPTIHHVNTNHTPRIVILRLSVDNPSIMVRYKRIKLVRNKEKEIEGLLAKNRQHKQTVKASI